MGPRRRSGPRPRVVPGGDELLGGSRVTWRQTATSEVEGYDLERRLSGVMTAGLENLRDMLEGR